MATQPSADEAASKPILDDRASIVSSAKMHIRILRAVSIILCYPN
jgi:hypothetical protein